MRALRVLQRAVAAAGLVLVSVPLLAVLGSTVSWPLRVWAIGLLALSIVHPRAGALVAAAVTPVSMICGRLLGAPTAWAEVPALTVAAGWLASESIRQHASAPLPARAPAALLGILASASVVIAIAVVAMYVGPSAFASVIEHRLVRDFFVIDAGFRELNAGIVLIEGVLVFIAVSTLARDQPAFCRRFIAMSVAGGAAAATFVVWRLMGAASHDPHPWSAFVHLVGTVRYDAEHGDANAAGSHYVLLLIPALQAMCRRTWTALLWAPAALALTIGFAVSQSRAALLATALTFVIAAIWWAVTSANRAIGVSVVVLAVAVTGASIAAFPKSLNDTSTGTALAVRRDFARIAIDLMREHPWFGVGIGSFYAESASRIRDPYVQEHYRRGENAHNNFLQIGAELGLLGLGALLWLLGEALRGAYLAHRVAPDARLLALIAGLAAFLLTWLAGHPLLQREPSFAFWGLLAVASVWARVPRAGSPPLRAAIVAMITLVVLVTLPSRVATARAASNMEHLGYGVGLWQRDEQNQPYRAMTGTATLFAPAHAAIIEIPMRLPPDSGPVPVQLFLDGKPANEVVIHQTAWTPVHLYLPRADARQYVPVMLKTRDPGQTVWLGRVVGSDPRGQSH